MTHSDPAELQIDHLVALKEAWASGAWEWAPNRLTAYGNDLDDTRTSRAVTSSVNFSKGDKDPSNWLPPVDVCGYLGDWIAIKLRWGLSMDQSEAGRIGNVITDQCPDLTIALWPVAPANEVPVDTTAERIAPPVAGGDDCNPSYPTVCIPSPPPDLDCGDIPFRRFVALPPDPHNFDRGKKNGIGCERG